MARPMKNSLSGMTFGRWSVSDRAEDGPGKTVRWHCVCSCGNKGIVRSSKLLAGRSAGCESCKFTSFDISGQTFGKWLVIEWIGKDTQRGSAWLCQCDCGNTDIIPRRTLVAKHSQSCGCLKRESLSERATKHGLYNDHLKEYKVWTAMKQRCFNPNNESYHNYGGRGVTVCDRWRDSFADFLEDMGPCSPGLWIERVNNDGNYTPTNCVWDTPRNNLNNKRWSGRLPID